MTVDNGAAGDDVPSERKGRADRAHPREYVVLRAVVCFNTEPPLSCGLIDLSAGGARLKLEHLMPEVGSTVALEVGAIGVRVTGKVIRTWDTPTGLEVAIQFNSIQPAIPGKLLQYKLQSLRRPGGRLR